jgi:membrane protein YdbS with pleckstrin-like domain
MLQSAKQLLHDHGAGGLFSALTLFPKKLRFESQDPQEEIVLLLRPHIITNFWWLLLAFLMIFVPLFWTGLPVISLLPNNYLFVLALFWYALILTIVFERFLMWFFSVNIVTDERFIDVDFYGLLFKHVSVAQLENIEDVNYFQKGIMAALFNYGDILIQTAAETPEFVFNKVPNPERIVQVISELIQQERQEEIEGRVR